MTEAAAALLVAVPVERLDAALRPDAAGRKLYTECLCRHYRDDYGLETRVVRFHDIFGPLGTYEGSREKSAAAICRKVTLAQDRGVVDVWGDGLRAAPVEHLATT